MASSQIQTQTTVTHPGIFAVIPSSLAQNKQTVKVVGQPTNFHIHPLLITYFTTPIQSRRFFPYSLPSFSPSPHSSPSLYISVSPLSLSLPNTGKIQFFNIKMAAFSAVHLPSPHPITVRSSSTPKPLSPFLSSPVILTKSKSKPIAKQHLPPIRAIATTDETKTQQQQQQISNSLDPIGRDEALDLYSDMVLGRSFEDMCAQMYYRGKMFGFVHLYNGQEAVASGFIRRLGQSDSVVSTYRDHFHALSKGVPARKVMAELFGKATGCCRGQGGSMHMFSAEHNVLGGFAFIGEGIPVATGAAFSSKYRQEVLGQSSCQDVTLAFFGDGTCNNGQFFECLNMAQLWKLPIVFVVENNLWAIGMSHLRSTSDPEIWKKGPAFGMPGVHVDGMDVLKVREVAMEAIGRARRGEGPTLVECETYRFRGHSLADPDELRNPGEIFYD